MRSKKCRISLQFIRKEIGSLKAKNALFSFITGLALLQFTSCVEHRNFNDKAVIVHILAEPKGLHPVNNNDGYQRMIQQCTQKKLMTVDLASGKLMPDALENAPLLQADSLTYTCILNKGMLWDNGREVNASDAIFSLKVLVCPGIEASDMKSIFANVESVDADLYNPYAFSIRMKKRYFDNSNLLSYVVLMQRAFWDPMNALGAYSFNELTNETNASTIQKQAIGFLNAFNHPDKARLANQMDGLGPYKLDNWNTGSEIVLKKKRNWWGDKSTLVQNQNNPERIIFKVIREMEPLILALKREEIDFSPELSAPALMRLQGKNGFNASYYSGITNSFSYTYMGMNMKPEGGRTPYFTNRQVRRAMALIMPVDEIIAVITKGKAFPISGFILPGQVDFDTNQKMLKTDIEQAKSLLDDAGWIDTDGDNIRDKIIDGKRVPFSFSLSYMISPVTGELVQLIKSAFYTVGIKINPEGLEFSAFYEQAYAHKFDAMLGAWSSSTQPEDPRQIWHSESWSNGGSNFVGFGSAYSDSLIDLANGELNPAKRKRIMHEIQKVVQDEQPYVFLFNATRKYALHRRFGIETLYRERPHVWFGALNADAK
jgi:ABC-type transport system substrate-binding protein